MTEAQATGLLVILCIFISKVTGSSPTVRADKFFFYSGACATRARVGRVALARAAHAPDLLPQARFFQFFLSISLTSCLFF